MTTTPNLGLELVDFDNTPWHDDLNRNFELLDAVITASTGVAGLMGAWINSLAVSEGEKWVDTDDASIWQVLIDHTTAASGTFEADRIANPTYWSPVASALNARGEWQSGVVYASGDLAYTEAEALYCVCAITHTSTTSQRDDIANWVILVDGSSIGDTSAVRYTPQTLTAGQRTQARANIAATSAPLITRYNTAGGPFTHTFDDDCVSFCLVGGGGGGGGGGLGSTAATGMSGGGSSGFVGETEVITRGAIATGTVNVGAKGIGAVPPGAGNVDGGDGGNTTWSDGTNSFTWGGGKGGKVMASNIALGGLPGVAVGTLYGSSAPGESGATSNGAILRGGDGGACVYGSPGTYKGAALAGGDAVGFSAGGGGPAKGGVGTVCDGGDGAAGFLWVIEYF